MFKGEFKRVLFVEKLAMHDEVLALLLCVGMGRFLCTVCTAVRYDEQNGARCADLSATLSWEPDKVTNF